VELAVLLQRELQPLDVLAGIAGDFLQCRNVYPRGLRNIEDVGISESEQDALVLLGDVLLRFGVLLAANADDRGKDADALLSCLHGTSKVLPCPEPSYARGGWHLSRDLQDIPERIRMEAAHSGEVVGEGVGLSSLQLLNQQLDVGGNEFLFAGGLLAVDVGDDVVHGVCSLGFGFCTSALKRGMYMPNATWRRRG
jgi:hypothetical protein